MTSVPSVMKKTYCLKLIKISSLFRSYLKLYAFTSAVAIPTLEGIFSAITITSMLCPGPSC